MPQRSAGCFDRPRADRQPPGAPAFSLIAAGQGGPQQSAQQVVVFSDYNNVNHTDMSGNRIESNFFREMTIGAGDVGMTFRFVFDAKLGNIAGDSTAAAFIKVLDSVGETFALLGGDSVDMTTTPATWTGYVLQVSIDEAWICQLLQFGIRNVASNSDPSGIVYDNIVIEAALDTDSDGVPDDVDNCTLVANPGQEDSNGDMIGNICDADVTGPGDVDDCSVNFLDLSVFQAGFFGSDPELNLDGTGNVNFADLAILQSQFFAVQSCRMSLTASQTCCHDRNRWVCLQQARDVMTEKAITVVSWPH